MCFSTFVQSAESAKWVDGSAMRQFSRDLLGRAVDVASGIEFGSTGQTEVVESLRKVTKIFKIRKEDRSAVGFSVLINYYSDMSVENYVRVYEYFMGWFPYSSPISEILKLKEYCGLANRILTSSNISRPALHIVQGA